MMVNTHPLATDRPVRSRETLETRPATDVEHHVEVRCGSVF